MLCVRMKVLTGQDCPADSICPFKLPLTANWDISDCYNVDHQVSYLGAISDFDTEPACFSFFFPPYRLMARMTLLTMAGFRCLVAKSIPYAKPQLTSGYLSQVDDGGTSRTAAQGRLETPRGNSQRQFLVRFSADRL